MCIKYVCNVLKCSEDASNSIHKDICIHMRHRILIGIIIKSYICTQYAHIYTYAYKIYV